MMLHIKNMVCDRCIMVVKQQLESLGYQVDHIALGFAEINPAPGDDALLHIATALNIFGFELINDEKARIIEQIKNVVIEQVHYSDMSAANINFSTIVSSALHKDYAYLSRLFSDTEQITLAQFIIQQKVEKVKELLQNGELNLNEIAFKMGYSSSAHLSSQFKMVAGLTPSQYKSLPQTERKALDKV